MKLLKKVNENFYAAKRVSKILELTKKDLFFSKVDKKIGTTFCALSSVQSCANSAQQCAKFSASGWEGVPHSG